MEVEEVVAESRRDVLESCREEEMEARSAGLVLLLLLLSLLVLGQLLLGQLLFLLLLLVLLLGVS